MNIHALRTFNQKKIVFEYNDRYTCVAYIKELMNSYRIFGFIGSLGTGKTTIIADILKAFDVTDLVVSPTFTYVNRYKNDKNQIVYHFDLYRIHSIYEFQEQGFDEYLHQPDSWVFIEWPEVIEPLLKDTVCFISLEYGDTADVRKATIYTPSENI